MTIAGLKKWVGDRGNDVQGGFHQANIFDGGRTYDTNRRQAAPYQPPANVRNRNVGQKAWDQFNIFDNGRSIQTSQPNPQMPQQSVFDQALPVGKAIVRAPAQMLNTMAAQVPQVHYTLAGQIADWTNNDEALNNAIKMQNLANEQFNQNKGGLFNAGTFYNADDARRGDLKTGVVKIGGGTLQTAATVVPFAKGGSVAVGLGSKAPLAKVVPLLAAEGAGYGGAYSAGNQLQETGRIDPKTLARDAALGAAGGAALPLAGRGVRIAGSKAANAMPEIKLPGGGKTAPTSGVRPANALQTQLEGAWNSNNMPAAQKLIDQMPDDLRGPMQQLQDMKAGQAPQMHAVVDPKTHKITMQPAGQAATPTPAIKVGKQGTVKLQQNPVPAIDGVPPTAGSTGTTRIGKVAADPVQPGYSSQIRNRGFIDTIVNDPSTSASVKSALVDLDTSYMTRNTQALQVKAANLVKSHPDIAEQLALQGHDDISVAVGSELMKKLQTGKNPNYARAIEIANSQAKVLTEAGRTAQAASIYGKLTPEGILRFAQTEINKYNKATGKNIKLSEAQADILSQLSKKAQAFPEGSPERLTATAKLVAEVQHTMPATLAEKLTTLQTMAQLLNPKTNIRNLGGNAIFGGIDNISQVIATPVDKLLSALRGADRTTGLPSMTTQAKGFVKGGKIGIKEAAQGINTGPTTQFDLNSVPVFRGKILGNLEKTLNGTLRGADRAAYTATFDDTVRMLQKVNKLDEVTPAMLEQAHHTAMYRTFQDTNAVSNFFVGMKKGLNSIGIGTEGKRFGLGDIVLKYPKTPGNLMARGIDYSPAGFIKSIFEASKPLFGREFNQKAFVDSFSRAIVGSGSAFGIGYTLSKNGIITAQPESNKDLRNVQKTAGLGGYQINVSGFKRWVASGFNDDAAKLREGDTLTSYDWAQPIAIPISAGAALGAEKPQRAGAEATNSVVNSANTLVEQPLLQGVQRLFGGYGGISDAAVNTATSAPASFIPTLSNQVNQLFDNKARVTTADNPAEQAANLVKAKIPGLAQTLPVQYDVLGREKERFQNGSNTPFNVLLNPAFVNKYEPTDASREVLRLYNSTGETKQTPNTAPKSITLSDGGGKVKLTGQKQSDYQKFTGERTAQAITQLMDDPSYQSLPDMEKVKLLSSLQSDINSAAKIQVGGDKPKDISGGTASQLAGSNSLSSQASDVQNKVAVEKFKTSGEKTMTIGDQYYFKTKDGTVKSMPKIEYDFNQADSVLGLGMDRAQGRDDIGSWMKLAEQKYNALESKKQLYDPGTEADKIADITLQQENLLAKVEKYQEYGGFKKGSGSGVKKGSLPNISVGIPSELSNPVVSNSSYKAPALRLQRKGSVKVARKQNSVKISAPKKLA